MYNFKLKTHHGNPRKGQQSGKTGQGEQLSHRLVNQRRDTTGRDVTRLPVDAVKGLSPEDPETLTPSSRR